MFFLFPVILVMIFGPYLLFGGLLTMVVLHIFSALLVIPQLSVEYWTACLIFLILNLLVGLGSLD